MTYMTEEEIMALNEILAKDKRYMVDYLEELPEDVRAEVIDGRLFYMASPNLTHQRLVSFLNRKFGNYVEEHKGICEVLTTPFGVRLNEDSRTKVEPDLMVVCDMNKLKEKECFGAPDFVAEIISPSTRSKDCLLKLNKYQDAGVREYWILDWERNQILAYWLEAGFMEAYSFSDKVPVGIFDNLEIDFSDFKR